MFLRTSAPLALLGFLGSAHAATLEWDRNIEPEVTGYRTYQGLAARVYSVVNDVGNNTSATLSNLLPGTTYYFAVTAYTADGLESDYSEEVSYTVPTTPVPPPNTAPIAASDAYSTPQAMRLDVTAGSGVLANDSDAENEPLTALLVGAPDNGSLVLAANGSFSYIPNAPFVGVDNFTYRVTDGKATSAVATVTITVTGIANREPIAVEETYSTPRKTALVVSVASGVLANDFDADGDHLTALLVAPPGRGKLSLSSNGSFTYNPNGASMGKDSFSYRATDGNATSAVCVVTILVGQGASPSPSLALATTVADTVAAENLETVVSDELDGLSVVLTQRKDGKRQRLIARFHHGAFTTETVDGTIVETGTYAFTRLSATKALLVLTTSSGHAEEYSVTMGTRRWRARRTAN